LLKREGGLLSGDLVKIASAAEELAKAARIEILKMTSFAKASHVGSALSVVDILSVLYSGVTNIRTDNISAKDRDVVILSKGHAASALYSVLALRGFFPKEFLDSYCGNGAKLGGHVTSSELAGVELSTGSLGHGLPYGLGIALSRKIGGDKGKVFVIMSDGECDEGTTWESALLANHHELTNLVVIIDRNRIQSLKDTEETLKLEPFQRKWENFGWNSIDVDGHDFSALSKAMIDENDGPKVIIANTTKGRGVSFMENSVLWHYRSPNDEELSSAIAEIERRK
jgi:transketolase